MTYAEKLKDPRWHKKRLEVFQAADFKCENCGDEKSTLHVHHLEYVGNDPWDTPIDRLECLCFVCHKNKEDNRGTLMCFMGVRSKSVESFADAYSAARKFYSGDDLLKKLATFLFETGKSNGMA